MKPRPGAWSVQDEILLGQLWGTCTLANLAEELSKNGTHRTLQSVYSKAKKLGFTSLGHNTESARTALAAKRAAGIPLGRPPKESEDIYAVQPIPRPTLGLWGVCW